MKRIVKTFGKLSLGKRAYAVFVLSATASISLPAQTLTTLHTFVGTDGSAPGAGLVQGTDGNLYGTALYGGASGNGTLFKIAPGGGALTTLYNFCSLSGCVDGASPLAGLVQAVYGDYYGTGDFYGTTAAGGTGNNGTVFRVTPGGSLTTLYRFCTQSECSDGQTPIGGLVQAYNGTFYGTTSGGGTNGGGTIFEITPSGALTTLYNFCHQSSCTDGANPLAGLVQATNGDFYGTTSYGGVDGSGTVFKITPSGVLTTLYSFVGDPSPQATLVQATNGDLYGTTVYGGAVNAGTAFTITQSGTLTNIYSFCSQSNCADGGLPYAGLVQGADGDLYGTTSYGGASGWGTVFQITQTGTLATLYSFCSLSACADGASPEAGLVQHTDGDFYGTTSGGETGGDGTVFSLSTGLGPFVEARPGAGQVGMVIEILGQRLAGATSVTFNGTAAAFTVVSNTEITATVPTGATIGKVTVVTPSGTLSSNVPFLVVPR